MTTLDNKPSLLDLIKKPVCFLGLGFGSGLVPKAPGTFGTLAALPLYYLMLNFSWTTYILITAVAFFIGIWICQQSANWLGGEDPSAVVWDEIVGYLVTMIAVPIGWTWAIAGFILFRFFDIIKPWPVSWADRSLHGGLGIMLDDVIAGLLAAACLHLFIYFY